MVRPSRAWPRGEQVSDELRELVWKAVEHAVEKGVSADALKKEVRDAWDEAVQQDADAKKESMQ